jgi:hypothetical protein
MRGTTSFTAFIPAHDRSCHQNRCPEPPTCRHARRGDEGARFKHRACNPHCSGHDNWEGCSLNLEGPGSKVFGSNVRDTRFPKCLQAPNNVIKYGNKKNPSVVLEDYHLTCRASGAYDDLFIIQFLPIYLDDMARA